jgi:integration host factor subunit beta
MTKAELVEQIAAKTGLNKRESAAVVTWMLRCIVEALQAGDKVELRGFGSFRCRFRAPRRGRNPKTAEAVDVPAKRVPYFKTGKALHERLNPERIQAPTPGLTPS